SDELLVLDHGRSIARGTPKEVLGSILGEHVLVVPAGAPEHDRMIAFLRDELSTDPSSVLGELRAPLSTAELAHWSERFPAAPITVRPPNLDDLFLQLSRARQA